MGFLLDSISYLHGIPLKGMNGDVANAVGDDLGILKEVDIPADDVSWAGGSVYKDEGEGRYFAAPFEGKSVEVRKIRTA